MSVEFPSAESLGLRLRPARDEDLPFMASLYGSTRAEELAQTGWPEEMQCRFLAQQFEAQNRQYSALYPDAARFVVEREGEPIGRLYLDSPPEALHLIDISLLPEARGRGLGSAILRDLVAHADRNATHFSLYVVRGNPARRLYERFGFAADGIEGPYDRLRRGPTL